jgi:hypothetical protein
MRLSTGHLSPSPLSDMVGTYTALYSATPASCAHMHAVLDCNTLFQTATALSMSQFNWHDCLLSTSLLSMNAGDLAPTYWATQLMLIALLVLTFTLLPYLTSGLMDALLNTSAHQRRRWAPLHGLPGRHCCCSGYLHSCCDCLGSVDNLQARICHFAWLVV